MFLLTQQNEVVRPYCWRYYMQQFQDNEKSSWKPPCRWQAAIVLESVMQAVKGEEVNSFNKHGPRCNKPTAFWLDLSPGGTGREVLFGVEFLTASYFQLFWVLSVYLNLHREASLVSSESSADALSSSSSAMFPEPCWEWYQWLVQCSALATLMKLGSPWFYHNL